MPSSSYERGLTNIDDKKVIGVCHEARPRNDYAEQALPAVRFGRLVKVVVLRVVVRQALLRLVDVHRLIYRNDWGGVLRCSHYWRLWLEAGLSREAMRSQVRPGWEE